MALNSTVIKTRRDENGSVQPIRPVTEETETVETLSNYVEGESFIEIKNPEDLDAAVPLTLNGTTDFVFNQPTVDWTVTQAHMDALPNRCYVCFLHLVNTGNSPPLETISKHELIIEAT